MTARQMLETELATASAALAALEERAELARERGHPGPLPQDVRRAKARLAAAQKALRGGKDVVTPAQLHVAIATIGRVRDPSA